MEINQLRDKQKKLIVLLQKSGFGEAADDLERMGRNLSSRFSESKVKAKITETDDFITLMEIGEIPVHSCQSYVNGTYNHCLMAYVIDANKRAIIIRDEKDNVVGRAIIKLFLAEIGGEKRNVLIVEPPYSSINNPFFVKAVVDYATKKANSIGAVVAFSPRFGVSAPLKQIKINSPPSNNNYEYSDTYGSQSCANGYSVTVSLPVIEPRSKGSASISNETYSAQPPT